MRSTLIALLGVTVLLAGALRHPGPEVLPRRLQAARGEGV